DAPLRLARRAVLHGGGVHDVLGKSSDAAAPRAAAALHPPRRLAPFSVPRPRLRLGGPVHAPPAPGRVRDLSEKYLRRRPDEPRQAQQVSSACDRATLSPTPTSRSCGGNCRTSSGCTLTRM